MQSHSICFGKERERNEEAGEEAEREAEWEAEWEAGIRKQGKKARNEAKKR